MSYLGRGRPRRDTQASRLPARFIPLPSKQRMAPPERHNPDTVVHGKPLFFPLLKKDLLVPQLTLREIAWTILDWMSHMEPREHVENVNRLWASQRLSPLEKDYVMSLLPKLRDEELRNQLSYED